MAKSIIKRMPLYIDSAKVAEAMDVEYSEDTNGEQMHGADAVEGVTTGNLVIEVKTNVIVPVTRSIGQKKLEQAIRNQAYIDIRVTIGGADAFVPMKVKGRTYSTDSKTGAMKGAYTMINGGDPVYVGM